MIWNVRPSPRWARRYGASPSIRRPSNQTSPEFGVMVPSIRLNAVVLPDPLGPISAVIEPCGTVNEQPLTALTPPKCFVRPRMSSSGSPCATFVAGGALRSAITSGPSRRAPTRPACPFVRRASKRSWIVGMIPFGSSRTTNAISPPKISSRELPPPICWLASSLSGSIRNAPSTGPHSEPRPPSSMQRMICTLITMSNIPRGSMNAR